MAKKSDKKPNEKGLRSAAKNGAVPKTEIRVRKIPIDYDFPEGHVAVFANNVLVQHSDQEFYLSFFQVQPPVIIENNPDSEKKFKEIKSVKGRLVAHIVIPPALVPNILKVMAENLNKFAARASGQATEIDVDQTSGGNV